MIEILIENPLLLLLIVATIGYPLGQIKVYGITLGVGAVLFVGLAFGSLHPDMKTPAIVFVMGQALFVYTVGLCAGPTFVSSFKSDGLKYTIFAGGALCISAALCLALQKYLMLKPGIAVGIYCGSLTASPALGGVLESIRQTAPHELLEKLLAEPIAGFSIAYPFGVIGLMLTINICQKLWKVDYTAEYKQLKKPENQSPLIHCTIKVQDNELNGVTVQELNERNGCGVFFNQVKRGNEIFPALLSTVLETGDLVMVAGIPAEIELISGMLGERRLKDRFAIDRTEYEYRRIFVSSPQVVGRSISKLNLGERFGVVVTVVRRGDNEFPATAEMVLELGDVVRVLAHKSCRDEVTDFFGDSYRKVSEVDVMTFSLGLVIGLILGLLPFPFPGGSLQLGFAGGPLIVGLLLGTFVRTGKVVWSLPYSASMTLKQVGLVLFLAGIGTRSGYTLVTTLSHGGGWSIFIASVSITVVTAFLALLVGHKVMKMPMTVVVGIVAGILTSTPGLAYVKDQTGNDLPDQGYACVFPFATIGKIIFAHFVLIAIT